MKKKFKLGIIGAGFMANSIIDGILKFDIIARENIIVSAKTQKSLDRINEKGISTTFDNNYIFNNCDFVLLAIKPQSFMENFSKFTNLSCKIISIMAGVKKDTVKKFFSNVKVARCMPNTPCSIGNGAVSIDLSDFTLKSDKDFIINLFSSIAKVVICNEDKINATIGVSGSAPAYFYLFVKSIIESGVKNGLSYEDAFDLAVNTMIGSGKMLIENKNKNIDELINSVCSKGGTTIEAIKVFNDSGLKEITDKAIEACINRAKELEKSL